MAIFTEAKSVWIKDMEREMHVRAEFKASLQAEQGSRYIVKLATSGVYHLKINGAFISYGPARAGKGYFRAEELDITNYLSEGTNILIIEVCSYMATSYVLQEQPGFLQAEVLKDTEPILWTGRDFMCRRNPYYIRKTQRYGYQRPMIESYRITESEDPFYTCLNTEEVWQELAETEPKTIISRRAPYPMFERIKAAAIGQGGFEYQKNGTYKDCCFAAGITEQLHGFQISELEVYATRDVQRIKSHPMSEPAGTMLADGWYQLYKLPYNATGMLEIEMICRQPATVYITFDEILTDGLVDPLRLDCANVIRYDLCSGKHHLPFFEVYTMQYFQIFVLGGSCEISPVNMIEYKHPPVGRLLIDNDKDLQLIADAAVETFRQNAVDIFMDCPSRERAGWLCDSFFTGRTEFCLTGENKVERSFLENFLHEKTYELLPKGMLPKCYPSDDLRGEYIPNWAMWLVVELEEYYNRTKDRELVDQFKNKVYDLIRFFEKYENEDGLLEHLESWVFIEWSKANDFTQDVNYPSNMLYGGMLKAAARLYGDTFLAEKADAIDATIRQQSLQGCFFTDHANRVNGTLVNPGDITESCQYYAFFFGTATPETDPELFEILIRDFGPDRDPEKLWPEVHPSAPFIGNYLRLDIMMCNGYQKEVLDNIKGFFLHMARTTGTLWEHNGNWASCNHGFASHVLYWLMQMGYQLVV